MNRNCIFLLVLLGVFLVGTCQGNPDHPAPATFVVVMETTQGSVEIAVTRAWAPYGVDRFYTLVNAGYYSENGFFRVVSKFVAQWGIAADPAVSAKWANKEIPNDPVVKSNLRGYLSFAADYVNNTACCRTTQLYVNYGNNSYLDAYGFAPFAVVQSGMQYLDAIYAGYGETPLQDYIYSQGNAYLKANFPLLDYITSIKVKQ